MGHDEIASGVEFVADLQESTIASSWLMGIK